MAKLISQTYGDALFDIAVESGKTDVFFEEIKSLKKTLDENESFLRFLEHPDIELSEKLKVVDNVFDGKLSPELVGLLRIVVTKNRSVYLGSILDYLIARIKELKKIGVATVTSAMELSEEQKDKIVKKLLSTTSYKAFEMEYKVDAELIGGITIRIGDRVIDGSVRNKIMDLKKKLSCIQLA